MVDGTAHRVLVEMVRIHVGSGRMQRKGIEHNAHPLLGTLCSAEKII